MNEELKRADDAYTEAIRDAVRTNNWDAVAAAGHAFKQARAAVPVEEQL